MSLLLKVIEGTPIHGGKSLCFSCRESHIVQGQQMSDLTVRCDAFYQAPVYIKRPVVECNQYASKASNTRGEMEKIAYILETKRGRPIGFFHPLEHKERMKEGKADKTDEDDD